MSARALHYNPTKPSAFSTVIKFSAALSRKKKYDITAWLELQEAYIIHRPVTERFLHNPYTVTNLFDMWECDLLDKHYLAKNKDMHRNILSVTDVLSKYLHLVPV